MVIDVWTWNVRYDAAEAGRSRRHIAICDHLAGAGPQIACLQEVGPGLHDLMGKRLADYVLVGDDRSGTGQDERVPILVRRDWGQIIDHQTFWLSPTPTRPSRGWDARCPRIATTARISTAQGDISVCSVHFDHRGVTARIASCDLINDWADRERAAGHAVLAAGDFNLPVGAPAYEALAHPDAGPLRDARLVEGVTLEGPAATWQSFGGVIKRRIDHIFVDDRWQVLAHKTLSPIKGRRPVSDHYPVVASLTPTARDEHTA